MKSLALLLAISTLAFASDELVEWDGLRVKWVPTATPRKDAFYGCPRTIDDARSDSWIQVEDISNLNVSVFCLPDDPRLCVLYDANGFVAGVQVGVLVSDAASYQSVYKMSEVSMFRKKTFLGQDVWTSTFYTVSPDIIQAGGREEMNGLTGTDGVWLETKDGYLAIPKNVSGLDPIWKKRTCIDQMGTHYYFNSTTTQVCATIRPLFLTYSHGQLVNVGWFTFGNTSITERPWVEDIPVQFIELINPNGPACLYSGIKEYGIISIHIYLINEPWNISC